MFSENEIRNIKLFEEEIRNIKQMAFDAAHPIGETYVQYPQQDDPMTIYNKNGVTSVWEEQLQYNGAFFRSSNALSTVWKVDDEDGYYTINGNTVTPVKVVAENGGSVSIGSATGNSTKIDEKVYKEYSVNGYSNAAAGYINKANPLSIQGSQNLSHSHTQQGSFGTSSDGSHTHTFPTGGDTTNGNTGRAMRSYPNGSIDYTFDYQGSHTHTVTISGNVTDSGGNESRPINYTYKIWKRIS